MKYTTEEFAKKIREIYPGDYDDLSDYELVTLWLKKYPNDINKVNLISRSHNINFKSIFNLKFILIFLLVLFVIYILNSTSFKENSIVSEIPSSKLISISSNDLANDLKFEIYNLNSGIKIALIPNDDDYGDRYYKIDSLWQNKYFNNIKLIINEKYILKSEQDQLYNYRIEVANNFYNEDGKYFDPYSTKILSIKLVCNEGELITTFN
jgi:hypothetical protein